MPALQFLQPEWEAPARVRAVMTTREGGVSEGAFAGFNLATHVGDDGAAVAANRHQLQSLLQLPAEPDWLEQVHGISVAVAGEPITAPADAIVSFKPGAVCAVLVADCLPVFLATRDGDRVGIAHAGWRGLAAGVVEATINAIDCDPGKLVAWLGPAIGPSAFEVGAEVRQAFTVQDPASATEFRPGRDGRYLADLPALARRRLAACGVTSASGGELCTYSDAVRFYSYRRDGATGRMAALAWLA